MESTYLFRLLFSSIDFKKLIENIDNNAILMDMIKNGYINNKQILENFEYILDIKNKVLIDYCLKNNIYKLDKLEIYIKCFNIMNIEQYNIEFQDSLSSNDYITINKLVTEEKLINNLLKKVDEKDLYKNFSTQYCVNTLCYECDHNIVYLQSKNCFHGNNSCYNRDTLIRNRYLLEYIFNNCKDINKKILINNYIAYMGVFADYKDFDYIYKLNNELECGETYFKIYTGTYEKYKEKLEEEKMNKMKEQMKIDIMKEMGLMSLDEPINGSNKRARI